MDRIFFNEQVKAFIEYLKRRFPDKEITFTTQDRNLYYEKFKHYSVNNFITLMRSLYEKWNYGHFPLIADIKKYYNELFAGNLPEYRPEPRLEDVDKITKQKEYKDIIEAMNMLNYLEDRCKSKGMEWIPFIKDMLQKDMVYLINEKKWTHSSKAVGNIFEPRKYYPPKYYI